MSTRIFQIGFNKCATTALYHIFDRSGVQSLHGGGRRWRRRGHPALLGKHPQVEIQRNILEGRSSLTGYEDFDAFFDMEYASDERLIENFRHFPIFATEYPDAKFILNTRDKKDWLQSRARHRDGLYMAHAMKRMNLSHDGVMQAWSDDFDRHHDDVRGFFLSEKGRLLVFDIDTSDVRDIVKFAKPEIKLWPRFWKRIRVTNEVA